MAYIEDRWISARTKEQTALYGKGLRWRAVWTDDTGKQTKKSFSTNAAAKAYLSHVTVALDSGRYVAPNRRDTTLAEYWPRLDTIKAATSTKNYQAYTVPWNNFIRDHWGRKPIKAITSTAVSEWLAGLQVGEGRQRRRISVSYEKKILICMKALLDLAVEDRAIEANPLTKTRSRKMPKTSRRYLSVESADRLIAELSGDMKVLILVILHCCLRPGEGKGIKVRDIDFRRGRISIERDLDDLGNEDQVKSREHREVPFGTELHDILKRQCKGKEPDDYLTTQPTGRPWTQSSLRKPWAAACERAHIFDLDLHELRHTGISWAIHAGANVKTIQRMAGHQSASVTLDIYGHLWDTDLDRVPAGVAEYLAAERAHDNK